MSNPIPFRDRLSCTVAEACAATGLGKTKLYEILNSRTSPLRAVKAGKRTLLLVPSIIAMIEGSDERTD
jgi:hypothetical protein